MTADRPVFRQMVRALGLKLNLARMATSGDEIRAWLIPGSKGFCIIESVSAVRMATCSHRIRADGYIGGTMAGPAGYVQGGFVPDGNTTVHLVGPVGPATVKVVSNVFFVKTAAEFSEVKYNGISGAPVSLRVGAAFQDRREAHPDQ
jgi:hypothetical protein